MRTFFKAFLASFFLFLFIPQSVLATSKDPATKFKKRVKVIKNFTGAVEKWFPVANELSKDPLFVALGLNRLKAAQDNEFTHSGQVTVADTTFQFNGVLRFNPKAASGQPIASLLSKTITTISGPLTEIGSLHALSADLDVVIFQEGGKKKIYARIIPKFTNFRKKPAPYLLLSSLGSGVTYSLKGPKLTLADLLPAAKQLPFLAKFVYQKMGPKKEAKPSKKKEKTIHGTINKKDVTITFNQTDKSFTVAGDGLILADFVADAKNIPLLGQFKFESLNLTKKVMTITGKVAGHEVTVIAYLDSSLIHIRGPNLKLPDFVPLTANLPFLNNFSFSGFTYSPSSKTVQGTVRKKKATVAQVTGKKGFKLTGAALSLSDFIPSVSQVPVLKKFSFKGLQFDGQGIKVAGLINGKSADVSQDQKQSKSFSLTGANLSLPDFIPATADIPFLGGFSFDGMERTPKGMKLQGTVNGHKVTVEKAVSTDTFHVTGVNLSLADFIPSVGNLSFLNGFKIGKISYSRSSGTNVDGDVNNKHVDVKKKKGSKGFSFSGPSLTLTDFIPESTQIPFLSSFKIGKVGWSASGLSIHGSAGKKQEKKKPVTIKDSSDGNQFSLTGINLKLTDFIPDSVHIPFLNKFEFKGLTHTADGIHVSGLVGKKSVKASKDPAKKSFGITGTGSNLSDFIPHPINVPFLKTFSLDAVSYLDQEVTVEGEISGQKVTVTFNVTQKSFSVRGNSLKLANFIPSAGDVKFLNEFAFDFFSYAPTEVTVSGKINGKAISVTKKLQEEGSFSVTGDDLKLSTIAPEVGALKAFDAIALDLVSVDPKQIEVDAKLKGNPVQVIRTRGKKPTVTINADDLMVKDIFSSLATIPGLNTVGVDRIRLDGVSVTVDVTLNGDKVEVIAHAKEGSNSSYVSIYFETLEAATFIPAAEGHAINDFVLNDVLIIITPPGSPALSLPASSLPGGLASRLGWPSNKTLKLSGGVNFDGLLNIGQSGSLSNTFKTVGLSVKNLNLKGLLSPLSFKSMSSSSSSSSSQTQKKKKKASSLPPQDKKSILSGLSLSAPLPKLQLPSIKGLVNIKGPATFSIGGDAQSSDSVWAKVPPGLSSFKPTGGLDLSIQFDLDIVSAKIGEALDAVISLDKGEHPGISLLALYQGTWKTPFGIPGINLANGGFKLSLERMGGKTSEDLDFFASADIGNQKNVVVNADLVRANNKISLNYFELDGSFGLGDFFGGRNIPFAEKFKLDTVKISKHGLEGKTLFFGKKFDAFLFDFNSGGSNSKSKSGSSGGGPNWVFAMDYKNFKFTDILPSAKSIKPLASFSLPNASLVFSEKGASGDKSSMSPITKDMTKDIFGNSNASFKIPSGIGLLSGFDPSAMGIIGEGFNKIGVGKGSIIMGGISGIFSGTPGFKLGLSAGSDGDTKGLPKKVMNYKQGMEPSFLFQWGGTEIDVGLTIPMEVKAGKDVLELATTVEVEFIEQGLGIKVLGEMDGTWHNPFGINGLSLENLKMDASIDAEGEVKIGFAGEEQFGKCEDLDSPQCLDIKIAADMSIALEDLLPDGVAFAGSANHIDVAALIDIAETLLGLPSGGLSKIEVPFFAIKNANLAFATPGATDPQLGLVSEGFAFGGTFFFMNKELGSVSGSGGETSGVKFKGKIADINLDVLEFKSNSVDIQMNTDPKFIINSDIKLLGAEQKVRLDIEPPHFEFDLTEELGVFGEADLTVRLDGFDLKKGTFDKNADISIMGEFKSDLVPWMEKEIKKGVEQLRASAKAKLEADLKSLHVAQKKVDGLNDQIRKIRAEDKKAKDRALAKLNHAESRVRSLRHRYNHERHEAHHCGSRWTHWACSPGWYAAAAATWAVYKVAEGALEAAKKIVAAAFDLDPRIAALVAERDVAHAALSVAEAVVKTTLDVEDFVLKELETLLEGALTHLPFDIQSAFIVGDLRDMMIHNEPMVFDMKFKMFGDQMHEYFAVKVPDNPANIAYDAVAFAILPAIALDKLTEKALKKLSPRAGRWIHAHIGAKLAEAQAKIRKQVEAEEAKYKNVIASLDSGAAKYKKAFEDHAQDTLNIVQQTNITDLMPDSLNYNNIYLAIGHSNHCLTVSKDGVQVVQAVCKDVEAGRWSTKKLKDGYVQLKSKGLCLKARKGDKTQNFEPLILAQCDKDDIHEQWKIVSSDGFYDKIVNRSSQKCLHFNKEDANPRSAFAVWTSCLGTDSQTFRPITDAEKPTWHPVKSLVKAENGMCLDVVKKPGQPEEIIFNPFKKEQKLYAKSCGEKTERFNYVEEVNGDIKLVHAGTGFCVYPKPTGNKLALRACDRGKDMFWRINAKTGSADQLFNPYRNLCMMLPAPPKGSKVNKEAVLAGCNQVPNDSTLMDFVK